jgi:hypothetical protein
MKKLIGKANVKMKTEMSLGGLLRDIGCAAAARLATEGCNSPIWRGALGAMLSNWLHP